MHPSLTSSRIYLSPVNISLIDEFHRYCLDETLYDFLEFPPFTSKHESLGYLNKLVERSRDLSAQYYSIHLHDSTLIGTIGYHSFILDRKSCEIGYGISSQYRGFGYFSESLNLLIGYLYSRLSIHRIAATTAACNAASVSALLRNGFNLEGTMRDYYYSDQRSWFDAVLLSKII